MMTDVIHLLPDSVANQIAAGEVIQRPASVVKELVENSIDAGATCVQIIIKDAGRTLIQVIDNGCGMSVTDARMAFERHATSKIGQASDLFTLHTMGFRGEALPSIAAVSEIEMRTMRAGDTAGTRLCISASKVTSQQPDVCTPGTNIMVKRIFFNLPARRKFLKKDPVELGHIAREFERLALVNTNVEFTLTHNDIILHKLMPASLKQRICDLFSKNLDHQLIPVSTDTSIVRIDGFVSLPIHAKRRGALQYFFVNGRNMRHPYFHKAVLNSYENLIPADSQPSYFINFVVDPETIDVNIHPQKYEIKFENEQPVWQILNAAINEALGRFNAASAIDFDTVDAPDIPAFNPGAQQPMAVPTNDVDYHYDPFKDEPRDNHQSGASHAHHRQPVPTDWEELYKSFTERATGTRQSKLNDIAPEPPATGTSPLVSADEQMPALMDDEMRTPAMFQLKNRYIVAPSKSGLMIIDQHRAHVRILFERFIQASDQTHIPAQRLIFPEMISLDTAQSIVLSSVMPMLSTLGFELSSLGGNDWAINSVPSFLGSASASAVLTRILDDLSNTGDEADVRQSQWQRIALSMAQSAAIKYGTALQQAEMDTIITDLFHLSTPDYTPDGHHIFQIFDLESIDKLF